MRKTIEVKIPNLTFAPTNQEIVLEFLKKNQYITPVIATNVLDINRATSDSLLARLAKNGLIRDLGLKNVKFGNIHRKTHVYTGLN